MKRLVLLINGDLGLRVLRYIISRDKIEIRGIILNSAHKRSASYLNEVNSILVEVGKKTPVICFEANADSFLQVVEVIQQSDFGISALFGHLLPKKLLDDVDCQIINLHPSLLPIGRGADPIPWSIIGQQKQGVTIHIIDAGLDTGAILSQKEISTDIGMNSGEIYEVAVNFLIEELDKIFSSWIDRDIEMLEQSEFSTLTRKSKDLERIRIMHQEELGTFGEFLRKLQALTYSDGRKPFFLDESGRLWQIGISLTLVGEEDQKG